MKKSSAFAKVIVFATAVSMIFTNCAYASDTVKKDESVFVTLSSDGSVKSEIVSDWLHSDSGIKDVKDKSDLKNITNLKGDEAPNANGEYVVWNSEKNDIYYQGSTDKALPIDVKITYFLDGTEIKPSELAGKSGKIKIVIDYKNNEVHNANINGVSKTVYTPFVVITAVNLPSDIFTNIKTNGVKVLSDGNNQVASFICLPGLGESLGIKNDVIDIPQKAEIEADAKNFKLGPVMITATSKLPDVKEFKNADKINELTDGIDKLKDAVNKLCDGTGQIAVNQKQLTNGIGSLKDGISQLDQASAQLKDGISQYGSGASAFANGAVQYGESAKKYSDGAAQVADGSAQIAQKTGELSDGLNKLVTATEQIKNGQDQITSGAGQSIEGIEKLKAGKQKEMKVISLLSAGVDELIKGVSALSNVPGVGTIANSLKNGLLKQKAGLDGLSTSGTQFIAGLDQLEKGVASIKTGSQKLSDGIGALENGEKQAASGAAQIAAGGAKLSPAAKQLQAGSQGLADGANKLNTSATGLNAGAAQLSKGADKFSAGIKAASSGASKLYEGASKLSQGTDMLEANMKKFKADGVDKISDSFSKDVDINSILKAKDEIVKLSEDYTSFTGIGDNMSGNVKFIMKTDEIKLPEVKKVETVNTETNHSKGFFGWLKGLFVK